jgi:hypothetical protein
MRWFIAGILAVAVAGSSASAGDLTPTQALAEYERSLARYVRSTFTAETRTAYHGFALPEGTVTEESSHQVWRDGNRWKLLLKETHRSPDKGKIHTGTRSEERVFAGKGGLVVGLTPDGRAANVFGWMDELSEQDRQMIAPYWYAVVFGYLDNNGGESLASILRASRLKVRTETVGGRALVALEGVGTWGTHTVWLDPAAGYLPRRIEQRKESGDWLLRNQPISSFPKMQSPLYPQAKIKSRVLTMDVIESAGTGADTVATGLAMAETTHFDSGSPVTLKTTVRFYGLALPDAPLSDDTFRVNTVIPDGTPVTALDNPTINYEWQDGKAVKSVNGTALSRLGNALFSRGRWYLGVLVIGVGVGAVCVTVVAARKYLKREGTV